MYPLGAIASSCLSRPCAVATLAAFLLASVGYPVWSAGTSKDLSQPFPCAHRRCGCRNADQCWRGCCCFTNKEKLAWAKAHDVAPPEYVAAAAQHESTQPANKAACCSTKKSGPCHVAQVNKSPLTAVIEAMRCPGEVEQWVAIGAIDVPRIEVWQLELPLCGDVATVTAAYAAVAIPPAPPPPWM